ncbi:hypothetical protein [Geobacter sp.]|uniref:hypothetical protein n=1 Tax=Geobacter sp. TaxID=46610 RepID=UPI0027BA1C20|nr:hypothetical protein [Geobacter sp.]
MARKPAIDVDTATAQTVVEQEGAVELAARQRQEERERLIAQCHEVIGRVQATQMFVKFGDVTNLMFLKQIKESKAYRDVPGIGTWEKFCEIVGVDRHTIDQQLLNIATFGEDFLGYITSFGLVEWTL